MTLSIQDTNNDLQSGFLYYSVCVRERERERDHSVIIIIIIIIFIDLKIQTKDYHQYRT
jgi:hypothetical protein